MGRAFAKIAFWDDPVERDGPRQMACDEALLESADLPILRLFRWQGPWISAGYFADRENAARAHPTLPFCRRWTGGGVVVHDGDLTFSLVAPCGEALAKMRAGDSYHRIHQALGRALRGHGIESALSESAETAAGDCFAGPVRYDVVAGGTKIAGGAQRRTRLGLLHQGSVQGPEGLPRAFGQRLAFELGEAVGPWAPPPGFERKVESLAAGKYASPEFLRGRARLSPLQQPPRRK